ncbi:helix-turn-helix transcriptional regulator [Micromonospora sp. NPDC049275]|uniref:helix-turn-helix domain-containing protein n=1 Tax=Micromonospora sp. NPDC049275 TaxID=3364268 RepID=UPI003717B1C1
MQSGIGFLLGELRAARVSRGASQEEFGRLIRYSGAHVGNVESGQRPLKVDYVRAVDQALQTGGLYMRLFEKMGAPIWLREWIEDEQRAVSLRWFEPGWIPGLLQTEEYARVTLVGESLTAEEVDRLVASRLGRQVLLDRTPPPLVTVVLDEAVVARFAEGQRGLMAAQLQHLVSIAERPNVQVHLVPAGVGMYSGLSGPFVLANLPDGGRVACADGQLAATITDRVQDIATLESRWERIRAEALPRQQSLELMRKVAESWT